MSTPPRRAGEPRQKGDMKTHRAAKTVKGTSLNARNGQYLEEGEFTVRELTARERRHLPECIARLEGPALFDDGENRVCLSVESDSTNGGHYVLVTQ